MQHRRRGQGHSRCRINIVDKRGPHPQPDSPPQLSWGAALAGVISSILKVGKPEAQLENQAPDRGCRAPFLRALPSSLWPPKALTVK